MSRGRRGLWAGLSALGIGAGWALGWVLAGAVTAPLAAWLGARLSYSSAVLVSRTFVSLLIGGAIGLLAGPGHWLALRGRLDRAGWLVPATVLGWAGGWAIAQPAGSALSSALRDAGLGGPTTQRLGAGLAAGLLIGLCHAAVLWRREWARRLGGWVAACGLAGALAWLIAIPLGPGLEVEDEAAILQGWSLAWGTGGAAWGAATALALGWLPRPRPPAQSDRSAS